MALTDGRYLAEIRTRRHIRKKVQNAPVVFSHEQKWALVRTLVRVNFPANEKIWYQIVRSLNIPKNQIGLLVSAVCDAADAGLVRYALDLSKFIIAVSLTPTVSFAARQRLRF